MKITDIELISFAIANSGSRTKWGYGEPGPEREVPHSFLRIAAPNGLVTGCGLGQQLSPAFGPAMDK